MTSLPDHGSSKIGAQDWLPGERPGELIRSLIDDPRGYRTMMMKIEPSPLGILHAHREIEQIYVIEGDFFDDDAHYRAGDFAVRMPGTMHRAGSETGCLMMIVYTPLIEAST
jgi:anti-sigma factor ChrR (cupin superfamily)